MTKKLAKRKVKRETTKKRKPGKEEIVKDLEGVVNTLSTDMVTALDIKGEKKRLSEKVKELKMEESHLRELVSDLKTTRNKLKIELQAKGEEEEGLKVKISVLKDDRSALESDKLVLAEQIKNLKKEKEQMNQSLEKTNDVLVKLKHHIQDFDDEIRS